LISSSTVHLAEKNSIGVFHREKGSSRWFIRELTRAFLCNIFSCYILRNPVGPS
jgi:hypothetical protein